MHHDPFVVITYKSMIYVPRQRVVICFYSKEAEQQLGDLGRLKVLATYYIVKAQALMHCLMCLQVLYALGYRVYICYTSCVRMLHIVCTYVTRRVYICYNRYS